MPRDYRRALPSRARSKRKQSKSCAWWLVVGVAVGVVVSNALSQRQSDPLMSSEGVATTANSQKPVLTKPSFRFEEILNDTEVDVGRGPPLPPSAPRPQPPAPVAEQPAQTTALIPPVEPAAQARSGTYVVQVGSFSRPADAERLRAQLGLLGLSTSVQAATLSNGRVTHRVRTGGYASRQEAEKVRTLLKRHNKDSISIPVK